ncbi:MAG: DUF1444 family protein [Cyanobacteria bacterium HKST-UBA02]|nr:DUF1444 family protein [Cyanobacteria bacterium HKST-UBA02]
MNLLKILVTTLIVLSINGCTAASSDPVFQIVLNPGADAGEVEDLSYLDEFLPDEVESPLLSRGRFNELMAEAIAKANPDLKVVGVERDQIRFFDRKSQSETSSFTDNAWKDSQDCPGERRAALRSYLLFTANWIPEKQDGSVIVPLVRSASLLEGLGPTKITVGSKPLAEGVILVFGLDYPTQIRYVTPDEFQAGKMSTPDFLKESVENLRSRLPKTVDVYANPDGTFLITAGGSFESSLIFFDDVMDYIKKKVAGDLVFGVPNSDLLVCTGSSETAVESLARVVRNLHESGSHPVSPYLYIWKPEGIELYRK